MMIQDTMEGIDGEGSRDNETAKGRQTGRRKIMKGGGMDEMKRRRKREEEDDE